MPTEQTDKIEIDGHIITNIRIEQAYKGNLHLFASIDGKEKKYIFRQGTKEYEDINKCGINNIPKEMFLGFIKTHFLS